MCIFRNYTVLALKTYVEHKKMFSRKIASREDRTKTPTIHVWSSSYLDDFANVFAPMYFVAKQFIIINIAWLFRDL